MRGYAARHQQKSDRVSYAEAAHTQQDAGDQQKPNPLCQIELSFVGEYIPIEPPLVQVRVRKHDIPLAIDYVALPFLEAHGGK